MVMVRRTHPTLFLFLLRMEQAQILAGEVGIEPTNAGIKIRCLTTWRLPIFNQSPNHATDVLLNLARLHRVSVAATAAILLRPGCDWRIPRIRTPPIRSSSLCRSCPGTPYEPPLPGTDRTPPAADRCEALAFAHSRG